MSTATVMAHPVQNKSNKFLMSIKEDERLKCCLTALVLIAAVEKCAHCFSLQKKLDVTLGLTRSTLFICFRAVKASDVLLLWLKMTKLIC